MGITTDDDDRDGKSNYMEGLMLLTLYLVIALACTSPSFSAILKTRLTHVPSVWVS